VPHLTLAARGEDPAAKILLEGAAGPVGQRAVPVEEPLVVGLEKQLQVLADRLVKAGPLRPPGPVDARRLLAHADREEQDRGRGSALSSAGISGTRTESEVAAKKPVNVT